MIISELVEDFFQAGIKNGDVILLHSDIRRTLRRFFKKGKKITPQDIFDSVLSSVGSLGTVIFPTFNFDFAKGIPFDIRYTPSQMGSLSEIARHHIKSVRTGHPIYSFVVIGYCANQFRKINNYSAYGKDSPFALLRQLDGKISILNLPDQNSMTYLHYIEEVHNVSYRYHKKFTGHYTDIYGKSEERSYSLFVRDLDKGVISYGVPLGEYMWKHGIYLGSRYNTGSGIRVIGARPMFDHTSQIIKEGNAQQYLYRIKKEDNIQDI